VLRKTKTVAQSIVATLLVLIGLSFSGAVVAAAQVLGVIAYPTFFGMSMLLSGLVLLVPWFRRQVEGPRVEERLSQGCWKIIRRKGAFWLVLAATFVLGPIFGALAARFLGLNDRRAWRFMFLANMISVGFWISLYIGAFRIIKMMIFGHHS
jgi:hypothetical protein